MTPTPGVPPTPPSRDAERAEQGLAEDWPSGWFEEQKACLFCGSQDLAPFVDEVRDWFFRSVPGAFAYRRCRGCDTLVLDRRPVNERLGLAYAGYYTHESEPEAARPGLARRTWQALSRGFVRHRFGGSNSVQDRLCAAIVERMPERRLGVVAHHRFLPGAPSRVLDYGCGNGDFLLRAKALGHRVTGVDFDEGAVAFAATRGLDVSTPEQMPREPFSEGFDMITANHVLEHVPGPRGLLGQFHDWLVPGGRLYLEMPNARAGGIARFGRFWRGFEAPRHFTVPSRKALRAALEEAGFAAITFHDRWTITTGMDAQSAAAARQHPEVDAGAPTAPDLTDCEFLTVTAERP